MEINLLKKRGSLRDTFILLFIFISCVPILGLGTISLLSLTNAHKKNISELEHQTLVSTSETTSTFFNTIIDTLSTNFDTLGGDTLETGTTSWQEMYAKKFTESNNAILEVSFISKSGKETSKYSKINKNETLLHMEELPLFKKVIAGEVVISSVHSTLRGQTVTIGVPLIMNGAVFGVVMAEVDLSPLITSLGRTRLGQTGYVELFDAEGNHIGSKNEASNFKLNFSDWNKISDTVNGKNSTGLLPSDRYTSPLSSVPVVSSTFKIPKLNWILLAEWPIIESDTLIENFRKTILLTIFISIIIVLIFASFIADKLTLPIKLLTEATRDIEKGNFDKQVSITTNDEIEELGESFNTMALGLKRLEELKNEFVYVAAHELRAPVTAIKGYLELVFDGDAGKLSPEMEHLLLPVQRSNERLVNLVNDLLKVARSEAGKLEITISPSDIKKEIHAILDEIKPLALKRNMQVVYTPQDELPLVLINTGSFKEIIMNFASNAVKYGNDNGTITVTHEIKDGMVSTAITDNGRGMSEEDQKHLFQKFFRSGDVKKTTIEGTGLGLFITKELVEKMNGTLSVSSTLGVGTTFTVRFKEADVTKVEESIQNKTEIL